MQGETKEEALNNIKDAVKTYLETVEEINKDAGLTIDEFKKLL